MSHFVEKCVHGRVVRQCRCIGPKVERIVECPRSCGPCACNAQLQPHDRMPSVCPV